MTAPKQPARKRAAAAKKTAPPPTVDAEVVDDVDDVPIELQFTSDTGERRNPETVPIKINGERFTLTQPSDTLIYLLAGSFSAAASVGEQVRAMMELLDVCLDPAGIEYMRRLITSSDNSFDDELLGTLTAVILETWAPKVAEGADLKKKAPANRAQRRQTARAAS